ncbi:type II toxin-antitoxin system RatA family toxin [Arenicella xantha]|uniref:Ribosome-associated toxin RatA of RatAB toxin-antitoxin module n=1 Tax=Arenicella xantha TaxID=644221 RepID=A0A395JI93_9GAMM|nr:type II toxin-antitoxin system RatA family toxin [Arenicella xantha]RBP48316.1 ribosome-associated toxin RatA of RatAB toxin-antitoxin module [Arenicella xantha]
MKVSRSALLPYSAAQMFDVIADVRSYPAFLNWCDGMEILDESHEEVVAKLVIAYSKLKFSFTTRNLMQRHESVAMTLVKGPFSNLQGEWLITTLNDTACKVSLDMEFEFESTLTQKVFGGVFQSVIAAQLDAFHNRAKQLYGV